MKGILVAVSPEGIIGKDNSIPWHYPIVWIFLSTPIIYLLLLMLGSVLILLKILLFNISVVQYGK